MPVDQYLKAILVSLVKHPEELVVAMTTDKLGVLLSVSCHKDDMGVIIGRAGETAKAIRHIIRIVGVKNNARVSVKINEPEGSQRYHRPLEEALAELL
jgi:predicted RNA-binding protein YlqC (UPF0109 family)